MHLDIVVVILVALAGSFLSFFSGFGLGTLLLPAFMIFMPPYMAVSATAIVHMLNNIFKLFLVGKYADRKLVISFGTLSIIGALFGAWLLGDLSDLAPLTVWSYGEKSFEITWIKLTMSLLILFFTLYESGNSATAGIDRKWLPVGGLLSGFFGGLSGHQGALRSAFLLKSGLTKEAMLGTRVVIACMVDLTRIGVYSNEIGGGWHDVDYRIVLVATAGAFTGAFLGNRLMKKSSPRIIHQIISWSLVLFALALGAGLI